MTAPSHGNKPVMLSAVQPSNNLTLGTYLGAIRNWVQLQNDYDCLFFAVDLHAITVRQDPKELRRWTYEAIATYIACGIDPEKSLLFVQSHVPAHAELAWILTCFTYMGELNRMTQFKDKSAKQGQNIPAGLFTYPVLMAADILLYQTELVPVGEDQKQHVELTRDIAGRMNNAFKGSSAAGSGSAGAGLSDGSGAGLSSSDGTGSSEGSSGDELFTMPKPYIPPVGARIMSLQDPTSKMSKSDPDQNATIFLNDSDDVIKKKLKRAVTDSGTEITFEDSKPGIRNLISIQSAITGKKPEEIVASYAGKMYGHLKVDTGDLVAATVGPIRDRVQEILADPSYLESILHRGAERARERAEMTLKKVYERVGFIPRR